MKGIKPILLLVILALAQNLAFAKSIDTTGFSGFKLADSALSKVSTFIVAAETDSVRFQIADYLFSTLDSILRIPQSFYFSFDSLVKKTISLITPPDGSFRLFTFNAISTTGTYVHYGFLQQKDGKEIKLYPLKDTMVVHSKEITEQELDCEHWLGALYYGITPFKISRKKYYLLLGYDGSDIHSNKKSMDVLWFDKGEPVFGKDIFLDGAFDKEAETRVIYEFHNESRMVMRYEAKQRIVVVDKLAPAFPEAVNDFYYYIPSGDYDYYALKKGYWVRDALDNLNIGQGSKQGKPKIMPSPSTDPQNKEESE